MPNPEITVGNLTDRLIVFRDERDWRQFHSLKDLIVSLNLESAELLELTQWKADDDFEEMAKQADLKQEISQECADVFLYLLLIAERTGIDLLAAAADKIELNEKRYPVDKSHGNARKYTDL